MKSKRAGAGVLGTAFVMVLLLGCSRSTSTSAAAGPESSTTVDPSAAAKLDQFARAQPGYQLHSEPVVIAKTPTAAIAKQLSLEERVVVVVTYDGSAWTTTASVAMPYPRFDFDAATRRVEIGDVTGDGVVDFLVPLLAQGPIGAVLSSDGGEWRAVPFAAPGGNAAEVYVGLEPHIAKGAVTAIDRSCDPDCGSGSRSTALWSYVRGQFVKG